MKASVLEVAQIVVVAVGIMMIFAEDGVIIQVYAAFIQVDGSARSVFTSIREVCGRISGAINFTLIVYLFFPPDLHISILIDPIIPILTYNFSLP